MGRKWRTPAELLQRSRLTHPRRTLQDYHETQIADLRSARELAALALQKEQARQALYYNQRKERGDREFRLNQQVWVYRPARGPGITKFGHHWRGPAQIMEAAGYDNFRVKMLESGRELVVHCSFLLSYFYPTNLLDAMARHIADAWREEAIDTMWSRIFPEASSSCSSLTVIGWTMSASSRRSVTCGVCGMIWGMAELASVVDGLGSPGRIRPGRRELTATKTRRQGKPQGSVQEPLNLECHLS
jgi:hypothetical protein